MSSVKAAVLGGKLQGVEVTYLAKCAGYFVGVFDRRENAQAFGMADECVVIDLLQEEDRARNLLREYDILIPAMENKPVLKEICRMGEILHKPVVFDQEAYEISSSKQKSNELFRKLRLSMPQNYPHCSYPVVIKPDGLSGSTGVVICDTPEKVQACTKQMDGNPVIQEFLEGRSFSLEVIGDGENFLFPQITEVVTDRDYDCKRIIAPAALSEEERNQMVRMGQQLAKALKIKGIFDIEVICHKGILKILEIDARVPSQTPVSVYHSCGINMIEALVSVFTGKDFRMEADEKQVICYQQIVVSGENIRVLGEHVMGECGRLYRREGFFGAVDAITDYKPGRNNFSAILITAGKTQQEAYENFLICIKNIRKELKSSQPLMEG